MNHHTQMACDFYHVFCEIARTLVMGRSAVGAGRLVSNARQESLDFAACGF